MLSRRHHQCIGGQGQRGMALIMLVFLVGLAVTVYLIHAVNANAVKIERDKKTAEVLAEAKAALIGWSIKNNIPGKLPCPEDVTAIGTTLEGNEGSCTNSNPLIGRLPWRALGADLRDGNGERLWYKLSSGFRSGVINSDSAAQLTIDGTPESAVAIIFSAGSSINGQVRPQPTPANPPDVTQYLDLSNNDGDETFVTTGNAASFNDRLILISHDDLFGVVEKKVAGDALLCLNNYAAANGGKYPYAARLDITTLSYQDTSGQLFGRLPDTMFTATQADNPAMDANWPGLPCRIISNAGWWLNWKEQVFFAVADAYKPTGTAAGCGTCLIVNPPSASADKRVVVIVAGKSLAGQVRTSVPDKGTASNYLEAPNSLGGTAFAQQKATSTFNDVTVYR